MVAAWYREGEMALSVLSACADLRNLKICMLSLFCIGLEACRLFNSVGEKDSIAWTALLTGYVKLKQYRAVFELLSKFIVKEAVVHDALILVSVLGHVHSKIGFEMDMKMIKVGHNIATHGRILPISSSRKFNSQCVQFSQSHPRKAEAVLILVTKLNQCIENFDPKRHALEYAIGAEIEALNKDQVEAREILLLVQFGDARSNLQVGPRISGVKRQLKYSVLIGHLKRADSIPCIALILYSFLN
ncbi:unnamed protein product [Dovyalis caffra]|uniref:Pentatricopeptide repeat-containing protein n=1 Tax=Dovyalis caffra TaxID=77055 RepID=A0AAV1R7K7_9ROSI|nr:unnamed protein product [Dovyalis caffra]